MAFGALLAAVASASALPQVPGADPYYTPAPDQATSHMPAVIIRNMREDRAGNIWFATFGGPIRYDGRVFTNHGKEVGLPNTRVFSLLVDSQGSLWFGSITSGASRHDGKVATRFVAGELPSPRSPDRLQDRGGLASNDVYWLLEDRDANLWFGTAAGVSRYDGKAITTLTKADGLVDDAVYAIAQDPEGRLWFGTQGGVCSFDGKQFTDLAGQVGRTFVNVRAVAVDRAGNLWFGGQQGAFRFDGKTLTAFTTADGLLDDFVGSMIVDRAGNVWFGHPGRFPANTGGGATRYDGETFRRFTRQDGLTSDTVYCLLEDKAGNIWFGSADAGVCRYDGKTFTGFAEPAPRVR